MKRRYVVIGLAAVAAIALVSTALGGPSVKSLVKNEVAKQLDASAVTAKAKKGPRGPRGPAGPAGPKGATGTPGTPGTNGTVGVYAAVSPHGLNPCSPNCTTSRSNGITSVTHPSLGVYCVTATGISSASLPPVASADWGLSAPPEGNGVAMPRATAGDCAAGQFEVITMRRASGSATDAAKADDVGFTFIIP